MEAENYDKARIELRNVLQIDNKSAESYYLLGKIEEHNKNWVKAINYYQKAIEIKPDLQDAHIRLGHFFMMMAISSKAGNNINTEQEFLTKAQEQADTVLRSNENDIDALVLNASILSLKGKTQEAINQLEMLLQTTPASADATLLLSKLYIQAKMNNKAQQVLVSGIATSPDDIDLKMELARFHALLKQHDEAIAIMQEIIRMEANNLEHRQSLANYYIHIGKDDLAENVFLNAIEESKTDIKRHLAYIEFIKQRKGIQSAINYILKVINIFSNNQELLIKLANLHYEIGDNKKAAIILEKIIKQSGMDPIGMHARKRLAAIYEASGETNQSLRLTEEILKENPNDYDALITRSRILLAEYNYKEAIIISRKALKTQPDSLEALHLLAESHLYNGDIDLAADTFKRAVEIAPDNIEARLQLARFMISAGEIDQAYKQVKTILDKHSDHLGALILETEIFMAQKNIQGLLQLLKKIKTLAPDNSEGWFRMGRVYKMLEKNELAREEFISAFKINPNSIDLLAELTDIEITLGNTQASKTRLKKILESQPQHIAAHKFLGMIYMAEKNYELAESELKIQLERTPSDVATYLQLGNMHYALKNMNQATQYYLKGVEIAPGNITLLSKLAKISTLQKKYDEAIQFYERILALQPDHSITINDLALLLANNKSDPQSLARAQKLIEKSKARYHPRLQDTLGWIYYLKGDYESAISSIKLAINKAPQYPAVYYHLGMAYMKNGKDTLAKKHLQTSLKFGNFSEREDAITSLRSLELLNLEFIPAKN